MPHSILQVVSSREASCPGDLFLYGGYHLGSETLDLAQAVVGRPVDEGVHADFGDQAREFVDPVIHGTREETLHGAVRDETHNVVDPADVPWLATGSQGRVVDALLHLRQAFRRRVRAAGQPAIGQAPREPQRAMAIGA